jgi:hypothetical protein
VILVDVNVLIYATSMTAAETGKRKDVAAATDQVMIVLSHRRLLA